MIGLAEFITEHRGAVERDLLGTGYTLDDVGASLSWDALKSFLSYTTPESALYRELHPELSEWSTTLKTNVILADIYDQLSIANTLLRTLLSHKKQRQPEPYKRPWVKNGNIRKIGKKPLGSVEEMRAWIRQRQVTK